MATHLTAKDVIVLAAAGCDIDPDTPLYVDPGHIRKAHTSADCPQRKPDGQQVRLGDLSNGTMDQIIWAEDCSRCPATPTIEQHGAVDRTPIDWITGVLRLVTESHYDKAAWYSGVMTADKFSNHTTDGGILAEAVSLVRQRLDRALQVGHAVGLGPWVQLIALERHLDTWASFKLAIGDGHEFESFLRTVPAEAFPTLKGFMNAYDAKQRKELSLADYRNLSIPVEVREAADALAAQKVWLLASKPIFSFGGPCTDHLAQADYTAKLDEAGFHNWLVRVPLATTKGWSDSTGRWLGLDQGYDPEQVRFAAELDVEVPFEEGVLAAHAIWT